MELVVLDLYGTIIEQGLDQSPVKFVKQTLDIQRPFPDYIEQFQTTFQTLRHNTLEEAFHLVADDFDKDPDEATFETLVGEWNKNALLSELYDDTEAAIESMRDERDVILVANVDEFTFRQIETKFGIRELFDDAYLSFETGHLKTSEDNMKRILHDHDVDREDVLYAGDSMASDIRPAKRFGFQTVLVDRRDTRDYSPKVKDLHELHSFL